MYAGVGKARAEGLIIGCGALASELNVVNFKRNASGPQIRM